MPGETPDWGVLSAQSTVFPVTDLGELAARLGSLDTFDRRGDLIWADGFECSLNKWDTEVGGTGAAVDLSSASARNGRNSVLLTAGSDGSRRAGIDHYNSYPALSLFGVEYSARFVTGIETLDVLFFVDDGTDNVWFQLRYDSTTSEFQYLNSSGVFVAFVTGINLATIGRLFHTLKLAVDGSARQYVRAIVDEREEDLSGIGGFVVASAGTRALRTIIRLTGPPGVNAQTYVDDVILTQNEPA